MKNLHRLPVTGFICLFFISLIQAQPVAQFVLSNANGCIDETVTITNTSTGATSYLWSFGDGTTSTEFEPSHLYQSVGTFMIQLIATDEDMLSDTLTRSYIIRAPKASFSLSPSQGCNTPFTVFFDDESILPDIWSWDFGDGGTSTAQNPIHSFTTPGSFEVTLTVQDTIFGCSDVFTDSVFVGIPDAIFNVRNIFGCGPLTVNFNHSSTNTGAGTLTDFLWDFGDGNSSTLENPTHMYEEPGLYTVSLTVTNSLGCTDTDTKVNYVEVIGPYVDFTADTTNAACPSLIVNFTDQSTYSAPTISRLWNFGDDNMSSLQNPSHTYNEPGMYTVSLTISDLDGCSRTNTKENFISILNNSITGRDTTICSGNQIDLTTLVQGLNIGSLEFGLAYGEYGISNLVNPQMTTTYYVRDSSIETMCTDTTQVTVNVLSTMQCLMSFASVNEINFGDPCQCDQVIYIDNGAISIHYFRDTLQITASPGQTITYASSGSSGIFDATGNPLADGTSIPETSSGIYQLEIFKRNGVQPVGFVLVNGELPLVQIDPAALQVCSIASCPDIIPTLGQWGVLILLLLFSIVGAVTMSSQQSQRQIG